MSTTPLMGWNKHIHFVESFTHATFGSR